MSQKNIGLFYNEICKNEKLQNEIKEVLGGTNSESDKKSLLNSIAKKYHFDFTPEDVQEFTKNLKDNKISLDDLSNVSGGVSKKTAALAFTAITALGSLCPVGSVISHATPPTIPSSTKINQSKINQPIKEGYTQQIRKVVDEITDSSSENSLEDSIIILENLKKEQHCTLSMTTLQNMIKSPNNPQIFSQSKCSNNGETTNKIKENLITLFSNAQAFGTSITDIADLVEGNTSGKWKKTTYHGGSAYLYENPDLKLKLYLTYSNKTEARPNEKDERKIQLVTNSSTPGFKTQDIVCSENHYDEYYDSFSITISEKLNGKLGLEEELNMVRAIRNALESIKNDKSFPKEINGIDVSKAIEELIQTIMPDASSSENFDDYYYNFSKETDKKMEDICVSPWEKKQEGNELSETLIQNVQDLFKNANDTSANNNSTEVKTLAESLKSLYENDKENAKTPITNLFKNSNYNWYHYNGWGGSYYLLKNKTKSDDHYYLSQFKEGSSRTVKYYKDSKNTADLNNSDLEKELHQRRLFRNALENLKNNTKAQEMKKWTQDLLNEIMPDKPADVKDDTFYRK